MGPSFVAAALVAVCFLASLWWEGNGYDWTTVVKYLVDTRAPTIAEDLDYDPEADTFSVTSVNEAALLKVAELIRLAVDDVAVLMVTVGACELD